MDNDFLEEERRIDLISIKKIDGSITNILDKTDKVAFYQFDGTGWHKQDVEGSLFVFSRSILPYYGFIIQNRRSLSDNVCELLVDGLEFQLSNLYLLYKSSNSSNMGDTGIRSIWFEDEADSLRISTLLKRLLQIRNESPIEGSTSILKFFEKPNDRERRPSYPIQHSPVRDDKNKICVSPKADNIIYNNRANSSKNCFNGYQGNQSQHFNNYQKGYYNNSDNSKLDHRSERINNGHGPKKEKNLFNVFNQAHQRYTSYQTVGGAPRIPDKPEIQTPNKPVIIMKRAVSQQYCSTDVEQDIGNKNIGGKLCKSRSNETVNKKGRTGVKDVKSIPITFQDLVNSVQSKNDTGRPISFYSMEGSSSSSVEDVDIVISDNDGNNSSPISSSSDPPPDKTSKITNQLSMKESAKLLMSPLDFQKLAKAPANPSPVKRMLFATEEKLGVHEKLTPKSLHPTKLDRDEIQKFKRRLMSALEEDDSLVEMLYNAFQKQVDLKT